MTIRPKSGAANPGCRRLSGGADEGGKPPEKAAAGRIGRPTLAYHDLRDFGHTTLGGSSGSSGPWSRIVAFRRSGDGFRRHRWHTPVRRYHSNANQNFIGNVRPARPILACANLDSAARNHGEGRRAAHLPVYGGVQHSEYQRRNDAAPAYNGRGHARPDWR